jgi:diketogulonate reductase-like aldo/keto reductase
MRPKGERSPHARRVCAGSAPIGSTSTSSIGAAQFRFSRPAGFERLHAAGLIRHWEVSNFDVNDVRRLLGLPAGRAVQTDQVVYNLARRGIELTLLPWCRAHGLPVMAYSPLEQGRLLEHPVVRGVASRYRISPARVALAWVLAQDGVCAIPEAGTVAHVRQNRGPLDLRLDESDMLRLDEAFPPPLTPQPLEIL